VLASITSLSKLQNLVWDFNGLSQKLVKLPLHHSQKLSQDINDIQDKLTAADEHSSHPVGIEALLRAPSRLWQAGDGKRWLNGALPVRGQHAMLKPQ
jgi:hypothetical protein